MYIDSIGCFHCKPKQLIGQLHMEAVQTTKSSKGMRLPQKLVKSILTFIQKLFSWVSIETSSSLEGRSAGKSDWHTTAILTAISISSSSTSSPRILLSNASRGSPACCRCRSHCPKLPPLDVSPKNVSFGSLPVNKTPNITPKLKTSLLSVYLLRIQHISPFSQNIKLSFNFKKVRSYLYEKPCQAQNKQSKANACNCIMSSSQPIDNLKHMLLFLLQGKPLATIIGRTKTS